MRDSRDSGRESREGERYGAMRRGEGEREGGRGGEREGEGVRGRERGR